MFDQLTWAIGMFVQSIIVVVSLLYALRNTRIVSGLLIHTDRLQSLSTLSRYVIPGLAIALLYLLSVAMLWHAYGWQDDTAIDWAVIVFIVGVLLAGPVAGGVAAILILPARAMIVLRTVADEQTLAAVDAAGLFGFNAAFWFDETWVWSQPGVVQLAAAFVLSAVTYVLFNRVLRRSYVLWVGIPLAIGVQLAFFVSAYFQWSPADAMTYLRAEALPAAIAMAITIFLFVFVLLALRSDYERQRSHQAELESAKNELRFYNSQVDPHFLNNSLSAISAVVPTSPDRAVSLLGELGAYFRGLCASMDTLVDVTNELDVVRSYVNLEKERLGDRLSVVYEIDENCLRHQIPRMSLQVLVENAIRHGVGMMPKGGEVTVGATVVGESIELTVSDNGPGLMKPLTTADYGVGLTNVQARLTRLYGENAQLSVGGLWGAGAIARITIDTRAMQNTQAMVS